jgi:hypothetical protein
MRIVGDLQADRYPMQYTGEAKYGDWIEKAAPVARGDSCGPTAADTALLSADRYYPVERFAAKGALILKPNYRGSAGYGAKFRPLNVGNLGLGDYQDVIL